MNLKLYYLKNNEMKIQNDEFIRKFKIPFTYFIVNSENRIQSQNFNLKMSLKSPRSEDLTFLKLGDLTLEEYVTDNFNDKLFLTMNTPQELLEKLKLVFDKDTIYVDNTSKPYIATILKRIFEGVLQNVKITEITF